MCPCLCPASETWGQREGNWPLGMENKTSLLSGCVKFGCVPTCGQITITREMSGFHLEVQMGWIPEDEEKGLLQLR